jgi:hypothetical protein
MAIRRCPYCKAIIDEQDKYCNNCGTQLLFPEDEYVEEEIPGDKIIDEEEEEEKEDEELLEEEPEETGVAEEEEETSEELEEPEREPRKGEKREEKEMPEEEEETEEPAGEEELEEEREEDEELEELAEVVGEESEEEEVLEKRFAPPKQEDAKKYQVSIEEDELVFKTKDLGKLTGTVDEEKENLEESERPRSDTREALPPWVSGMKGGSPQSELEEEEAEETTGEVEEEKPPTRPEWTTDSGIGIPERVTQEGLPFRDSTALAEGEEHEMAVEEEGVVDRELRQRPGFSLRLKAKLVDLVFITALWLISLWFTSQVIGVSFFRLIAGSPGPVLAFYFILLLLYFFLFLYFLGETLGDHYFSPED